MTAALVVRWSGVRTGRERESLELARQVDELWGKYRSEGKCGEAVWLIEPEGPGIWFATGEPDVLLGLRNTVESRRITALCSLILEDYRTTVMLTGEAAEQCFADYAGAAVELGYMPAG